MNTTPDRKTVLEGGHMPFKNDAGEQLEVSPIDQENVAATLDDVQERFISGYLHLDPDKDTSTLGSTGKRLNGEQSSDIDIAIDYSRLQEEWALPEWTGKRIEEWVDLARSGAEKCGVEFAMAATVCSLRWPIVNDDGKQNGEYVQVDLMPTTNMKMTRFGRFSQQQRDGETFFKGSVRNIMLAIMARCAYHKDLTDDTHVKVLSDGTEKEVHNEYEGWTYDQNTGLHLCHKKYMQYSRNGNGFKKGDWKPHASVVDSPVISSDPDEIVEMIFGKGVTPDDVDSVQKMWKAWKNSPAVKENPDLVEEVKTQVQRSAQNNSDLTFPDFDGEEFVNEAKIKKDPSEQVDDYIKSLSRDQIQTLTLRCSELLDKWNEPQGSDTVLRVRQTVDNDVRFLKFLRKTVPLTEPKTRDMGANTFVQKFFDPPFDLEAFIGKMAKEKGIPFSQAEQEWERSIMDSTHVGRYAHILADDAVNGRPPSKEGDNPKEVAIYTAIYDYAQKLVEDATDVESEVSLHASSATVGGKFDLLMKKKGVWTLVDWKTAGEDLDDVPTGKVGIDELTKNINNNPYNKYALQLNVYEWAAKDSGKIPKDAVVSKELHHFQYLEDGKPVKITVVKVPDFQELVQAMVERAIELGVVKRK